MTLTGTIATGPRGTGDHTPAIAAGAGLYLAHRAAQAELAANRRLDKQPIKMEVDMADQCCPMDTEPLSCTCLDGCDCMCLDCSCEAWGEEPEPTGP